MRRSWNRMLEAALSGLLAGLLAAGPALAQQPAPQLQPRALSSVAAPKLTIMVVPLDPPAVAQAPRLMYQAEQAVVGTGRFELVRLADALDAQGARERDAEAREAAAVFQEGLKAYDELDTEKALAQFDKAAQLYEATDLSRHFEEMSRARVMKIASYVANGDKKGFTRELKEVLARNPRAEFSPNYFPADELAVVERTRKAVLADATRTLQVKTGEVIAQIYVDGQFRGASPQTLSDLTPSEHFVTAIAPGYAPAQGKFRGEAELTLSPVPSAPRLKAWMDRITESPEGADRDAALRELGAFAGTQQVLALVVRGAPGAGPQDAIAVRLDVSDGHNLGYATAPVPFGGEAMEAGIQSLLAGVLQADTPRSKDGPTTHYPSSKAGSGRRTAGYVLLGTGAALVAGGVYFGLQASAKSDEFKKTPQTDTRTADMLRSDGKTFALIADIGVIAGLISAGTGTWLAFTGGGGGGKAEARPRRAEPPPPPGRETVPAPRPADNPVTAPPATDKPAAKTRAEQDRRTLEEYERIRREVDERLKREEEEERRTREEEERRRREEEAKRKREEEEQRKREEEERKKRPPLDEDDLRYY